MMLVNVSDMCISRYTYNTIYTYILTYLLHIYILPTPPLHPNCSTYGAGEFASLSIEHDENNA